MEDAIDESWFTSKERSMEMTEDAKKSELFDLLWQQWRDARAYAVQKDGSLKQVPLSRQAYPDSKEDCDVLLWEERIKRDDGNSWEESGYILSLQWIRNVKETCRKDIEDWLTSVGVSENEELFQTLTEIQKETIRQCRERLEAYEWRFH